MIGANGLTALALLILRHEIHFHLLLHLLVPLERYRPIFRVERNDGRLLDDLLGREAHMMSMRHCFFDVIPGD